MPFLSSRVQKSGLKCQESNSKNDLDNYKLDNKRGDFCPRFSVSIGVGLLVCLHHCLDKIAKMLFVGLVISFIFSHRGNEIFSNFAFQES